jgi:hypothetical protein
LLRDAGSVAYNEDRDLIGLADLLIGIGIGGEAEDFLRVRDRHAGDREVDDNVHLGLRRSF